MNLRELRYGIEIETVKRTREQIAWAIHSVVGGHVRHIGAPTCYDPWEVEDLLGRKWKVVNDASLTNVPSNLRAEIVSPVLTYNDLEQLQEVVRAIRRAELNRIWYGYHNNQPQHYDRSRYHGVNLHNVWYRGTVEFRWFEATLHAGKIKAYLQFCLAIAAKALNGRAASSRKRDFDPQSAKYDFRVFLLHLGLIGDEFKTARLHLMKNMPGDAAFKNGRPKPDETENTIQTTEAGSNPGLSISGGES